MNILIAVLIAIACWVILAKGIIMVINHYEYSPIIIIGLMYYLLIVGYITK